MACADKHFYVTSFFFFFFRSVAELPYVNYPMHAFRLKKKKNRFGTKSDFCLNNGRALNSGFNKQNRINSRNWAILRARLTWPPVKTIHSVVWARRRGNSLALHGSSLYAVGLHDAGPSTLCSRTCHCEHGLMEHPRLTRPATANESCRFR